MNFVSLDRDNFSTSKVTKESYIIHPANCSFLPFQYFALNMISCASDLTMEFDWIHGNGTYGDPNLRNL